jgi:cytochrome c553
MADISDYDEIRLAGTLRAYKNDASGTSTMHRLARSYSDEDIHMIAAYLGAKQE